MSIGNRNAVASARTSTSAVTFATTIRGLQENLGVSQAVASGISIHKAVADANLVVDIAAEVRTGGMPSIAGTIASFSISQMTHATAFTLDPLFGRSAASTQGAAGWVWLYQDQESDIRDSFLRLTWDFEDLQLQTAPTSSLAYIRDTVTTVQVTQEGQFRLDEVGFLSTMENGVATTRAFDLPGSRVIRDWLADSLDWGPGMLTLDPDAESLAVSIPLLKGFDELALAIFSTHNELSYEAPPSAVIQVEEAAGRRVTGNGSDPQIHWDNPSGTLSFDRIPIDLLNSGDTLGGSRRDYLADPLLDGFLEIDPLVHIGTFDGREYFSGGDLRLFDGAQNLALTASVPTLVFEDGLYARQGFNGFAPLLTFEQNSINTSPWLADFLEHVTVDSLYLPELFVGVDTIQFGEKNFSAPVSAFLSFAGPPALSESSGTVPEPGAWWLFCGGFTLLVLWRQRVLSEADGKRQVDAVIRRIVG